MSYHQYDESNRLADAFGHLELARTRELLTRYLPEAPATILDIGGARGPYALWLAETGHEVHLVDMVSTHLEEAGKIASDLGLKLAGLTVGDARKLDHADASMDTVMLHGPLYHLVHRAERLEALREARRVLRPGGRLFAFAINRFAGLIYGVSEGLVFNEAYMEMVEHEVKDGRRANSPAWADTFGDAFFHLPGELKAELEASGFIQEALLGVVGPAWQVPDLEEAWKDPTKRATILTVARLTEQEPLLGPRLLAVARK